MMPALGLVLLTQAASPYVLAIGVNDGAGTGEAALAFADDDAAEAVRLFADDTDNVFLHTTFDEDSQQRHPQLVDNARPATLSRVRNSVAVLERRLAADVDRGERPTVLVWLSGHAAYDERGHAFFPLEEGRLTARGLRDEVVTPLAGAHRVYVVIDSCFASSLVGARASIEEASTEEVERLFLDASSREFTNVGFLTGATHGAKAYEWGAIASGVFSAIVRAGLRGAADVDRDGVVRHRELLAFVNAAAAGVRVPEARPKVVGVAPKADQDAVLARREWMDEVLVLSSDLSQLGTIHIVDETGAWLLAGRFESAHEPELWLPAGRRLFLRSRGNDFPLVANQGRLEMGAPAPVGSSPRSLLDEAFREGLFATSFGPSFYRGFAVGVAQQRRNESSAAAIQLEQAGPLPALTFGVGALGAGALALVGAATAATFGIAFLFTDTQLPALRYFAAASAGTGLFVGAAVAAAALGTGAVLLWE